MNMLKLQRFAASSKSIVEELRGRGRTYVGERSSSNDFASLQKAHAACFHITANVLNLRMIVGAKHVR